MSKLPPIALGYEIPIPEQPSISMTDGMREPSRSELAAILAIQQLEATYCQLHEHGSPDEIADLFVDDAQIYALYLSGKGFRGRKQIRDWYAWWWDFYAQDGHWYRHRSVNHAVEIRRDYATSSAILLAEGVPKGKGIYAQHHGKYVSRCVNAGGRWLFSQRWIMLHAAWSHPGISSSITGLL